MMSEAAAARPPCPITGRPAVRLVQSVSSDLLNGLWRASFGVLTARQLRAGTSFGLWESPCGLMFFDPMIAGDAGFYRDLYGNWRTHGPWAESALGRADYARAATLVRPGDRVLDIGCGAGAFAGYVRHATHVGLDANYLRPPGGLDIRQEGLADHAAAHTAQYDVVCAFHVIEHVPDLARFIRDAERCLKPGGSLVLAVPKFPSAINDIPNFVFNAPPHHLTWWSERALRSLAEPVGLEVLSIEGLPLGEHHALGHWMGRMAPPLTGERYFRHALAWHGGLLWSFAVGRLCAVLFGAPPRAAPVELLMIARKART